MTMPPMLRRLMLTVHVAVSVGWLGAVAAVLALGVAALDGGSPQITRGALLVMEPLGRYVILPLAVASLATGVVQSLGTPWGLVRHYWVLFKLVINAVAMAFLLMYLPTFSALTAATANPASSPEDLTALASSLVLHAGVAVLLLLAATALGVVKPRGRTPFAPAARRGPALRDRSRTQPDRPGRARPVS